MTTHKGHGNSRTIAGNSFWFAMDASVSTIVLLVASVPVARVLGPQILGHYVYLVFVTTIAQRLANAGIPATVCKYMAETLGSNRTGHARAIYAVAFRHQLVVATLVTSAGLILVEVLGDPTIRLVSRLIVLSMWPSIVNNVPAQANVAAENMRGNVPASLAGLLSYSAVVALTLVFGWGLVGLAIATLVSRVLEAGVRIVSVQRRLRAYPREPLPTDLRRRMFAFSRQSLMLLALGLVVWDRSELFFLRHFCTVQDVAFYSVAFSVTTQLLVVPRAFSAAIGATMLAQYGRDRTHLRSLMENATRYVALLAVPMFLGMVAVANPIILTAYGPRYVAVVPVLMVLSGFAIARAFQAHSESLLQAIELQGFMVRWLGGAAVMNLTLDWLLIPKYGALGAAIANGIAQTFAVGGVWLKASAVLRSTTARHFLRAVFVSGLAIVVVVLPLSRFLTAAVALLVGIPVGAAVFALGIRLAHCLGGEDWVRLNQFAKRLPHRLQPILTFALTVLIPGTRVPRLAAADHSK